MKYITKKPIDLNEIRNNSRESPTLAQACLDYLHLEHAQTKKEFRQHILKHFQQRLRTGKSLAVKITSIEEHNDEMDIRAKIDYSKLPYENPETVLSGLRYKEKSTNSSGSFVNGIPVNKTLSPTTPPEQTKNLPTFTVESIQMSEENPCRGEIELNALKFGGEEGPFSPGQYPVKHEEGEYPTQISEGDRFLLDPTITDYTAESAYHVLTNPEYNGMYDLIRDFTENNKQNSSTKFDTSKIDGLLDWMNRDNTPVFGPNPSQEAFIRDTDHELSLLQGPPGTGKTSLSVAPAIVGRLLAFEDQGNCRALVTGASNKSINEVMEDVVELIDAYNSDSGTGDELDDVMLLRATELPEDPDDRIENVAYTPFHDKEQEHKHIGDIEERLSQNTKEEVEDNHVIVFATPRRAWTVGKKLIDNFALQSSEQAIENPSTTELEKYGLFDLVVADESSMMDMPQFLTATALYDRGGNVILSGDHRQLPPVQKHEWDTELRPSIRKMAPYLSVLNFFRVIRGDKLQVIDDDLQDLIEISGHDTLEIPLHQLEQTYRCHEKVAEFLQKWVYLKLDDLPYRSDQTTTINHPTPLTEGTTAALEPSNPMVIITYDDTSSQQANELEAKVAAELIRGTNDDDTVGIVTPHNAQRGLLESTLTQKCPDDTSRTDVDTVERFQGGERDIILLSATVSDPDYIASESEFLLNLNRLNVAMSRMKKKLIVIASESIFDHISLDVDEYNQSLLWKGLAKEAGMGDESHDPQWEGLITDFTGLSKTEFNSETRDTTVKVYTI